MAEDAVTDPIKVYQFKPKAKRSRDKPPNKTSLLRSLKKYANEVVDVRMPGGVTQKLKLTDAVALTWWREAARGNVGLLKLLVAYLDGQPPGRQDASMIRSPEENARLIMGVLHEMDAINNQKVPRIGSSN